ncbi:hypothetical protein [Plantactinospora sp. KLBMP9567]|uniref:hypothetical protein n=1 Tax=Plantactinospora sp. KLBMP9567 TaxID=3085900 RepID=UPI0029829892|nr:hypothetical protein [Plantactinospora sp. KLBMP9567]MDW5326171.1 hypothetical protein [Plantactinospora sp. KLBMP9567]
MTRSKRRLVAVGAALVASTAGLIGAGQAGAAGPTQVPPEGTVCTSQLRADAGVVFSGSSTVNSGGGPLWSVRVTGTAAGPQSEVLRTPARTLPPTTVVPPVPGTWFFQGCLRNTGPLTTSVQLQLNPV